jgi:prephenate dehydratase
MSNQIAFLGPIGTFGHEAAKMWRSEAVHIPFSSHLHILEAVEKGKIAEGIVAVENSIDGSVMDVLDYFIHNARRARVQGEVVLSVNQCLWGRSGTKLEDVRVVISHPKGLGQCSRNIYALFPNAGQEAADSTAVAVSRMLQYELPAVAIAGAAAGQDGAIVLRENFQDRANNSTRFWVVGRRNVHSTGNDRTSLAFELFENAPGALLSVLAIFASRGLNLSKVESRPSKEALGKYVFLVDVDGHKKDEALADALNKVRVCTPRLKVFGSYSRK